MWVFQETNITNGIYTHALVGYHVFADAAPSQHRGGVAVFYRNPSHLQVEALQHHGMNVLSFQVALGISCWFIVKCYLSPNEAVTIPRVVTSIGSRPCREVLLETGYFNTNMAALERRNADKISWSPL